MSLFLSVSMEPNYVFISGPCCLDFVVRNRFESGHVILAQLDKIRLKILKRRWYNLESVTVADTCNFQMASTLWLATYNFPSQTA